MADAEVSAGTGEPERPRAEPRLQLVGELDGKRKLGVSGGEDAVAEARALGLV